MKIRLLMSLIVVCAAAGMVILYRGFPARVKPVASVPAHAIQAAAQPSFQSKQRASDEHEAKVLAMALEKKPGHTPVLFKLAMIEVGDGRLQDAEKHLQEIVHKEPGNPEAKLELGKVLFQLGDVQGALEQTEEILKSHPTYEDALYNLGAIYGNLGNKERAAEYWGRLIALDSRSESGQKAKQMLSRLQAGTP